MYLKYLLSDLDGVVGNISHEAAASNDQSTPRAVSQSFVRDMHPCDQIYIKAMSQDIAEPPVGTKSFKGPAT